MDGSILEDTNLKRAIELMGVEEERRRDGGGVVEESETAEGGRQEYKNGCKYSRQAPASKSTAVLAAARQSQ
jgi:hypothetical protein